MQRVLLMVMGLNLAMPALADECDALQLDPDGDKPLQAVHLPPQHLCRVQMSHGYPIPDRECTPGAVNPSLTADVLRNPDYRTSCNRDLATSAQQKAKTYRWYGIPHPQNNRGANQVCELDHLVSLELGGADTLDNLWPECGPDGVALRERYFKVKDIVENYLAAEVKAGRMPLADAQKGIAEDWTQYLEPARKKCPGGRCR